MVMWKGIRVGQARKKFGVEYPDMYSKDSKVRYLYTYFDAVQQGQQGKFHGKPPSLCTGRVPTPKAARFVEIGVPDPDPSSVYPFRC
jgi:hypothetical protein